jgi:hypothetical protein
VSKSGPGAAPQLFVHDPTADDHVSDAGLVVLCFLEVLSVSRPPLFELTLGLAPGLSVLLGLALEFLTLFAHSVSSPVVPKPSTRVKAQTFMSWVPAGLRLSLELAHGPRHTHRGSL